MVPEPSLLKIIAEPQIPILSDVPRVCGIIRDTKMQGGPHLQHARIAGTIMELQKLTSLVMKSGKSNIMHMVGIVQDQIIVLSGVQVKDFHRPPVEIHMSVPQVIGLALVVKLSLIMNSTDTGNINASEKRVSGLNIRHSKSDLL